MQEEALELLSTLSKVNDMKDSGWRETVFFSSTCEYVAKKIGWHTVNLFYLDLSLYLLKAYQVLILWLFTFCRQSIPVQPRCWETLGRWTSSPNCLLMWNPDCELSSMVPWTSCSSYPSYSLVIQWSTHTDSVLPLQQVLQVKPNILCLRVCHLQNTDLVTFFRYPNGYFNNKCDVSAVVPTVVPPEEHFPKMGYFHKSMPNPTDLPPQKIAGTFNALFQISWHVGFQFFLLQLLCPEVVHHIFSLNSSLVFCPPVLYSAWVCAMLEVFCVSVAHFDKHRQTHTFIQWEVRDHLLHTRLWSNSVNILSKNK